MRSTVQAWLLLVLAATAVGWSKELSFECNELAPGASQSYLQTFPVRNRFVAQIAVAIEASNVGTEKAPKCHIQWTVRATTAGRSRVLFRHTDDREFSLNGASLEGTSPDGSKLLLDFFTAAGDYTDHHPVVYDLLTGTWSIREVGTRITRDLPRCDYFTFLDSVTNDGDVLLSVPKSPYVDKGCPDQGEWLLNMKADTVSRVEAHAPLQPPSSR
jgi:hypothetical protein